MHSHPERKPPKMAHAAPAPGPISSVTDARHERFGAIAISTWFLGGWGVLFILMLLDIGPVTWISGWLNRIAGSDSPTLAFAIAFGVISLPVAALQLAPWQDGSPFLRGAQRALRPNQDPHFVLRIRTSEEMTAALRRMTQVVMSLLALSLTAGVGGYGLMTRAPANAGEPLPALSPHQIIAQKGHLPRYVRLTGLAAGFPPNWVHRWSIRQTRYADLYFPVDTSDGPAGAPAQIIGKISYVLSDGEGLGQHPMLEMPVDGTLETTVLPGWMRQRMAEQGFVVSNPVVLFTRDEELHGRFPGPDWIGAGFVLCLGIGFAVVFAIIGSILAVRRHRLLDTERHQR